MTRAYKARGDLGRARVYADSARMGYERRLRDVPESSWTRGYLGMSLAYLGRKDEAIRQGELAVEMLEGDRYLGTQVQYMLVHIYIRVGEHEKALDRIETLLRIPSHLSPGWLRVDPTFDPLRRHPRFQALLAPAPTQPPPAPKAQ